MEASSTLAIIVIHLFTASLVLKQLVSSPDYTRQYVTL